MITLPLQESTPVIDIPVPFLSRFIAHRDGLLQEAQGILTRLLSLVNATPDFTQYPHVAAASCAVIQDHLVHSILSTVLCSFHIGSKSHDIIRHFLYIKLTMTHLLCIFPLVFLKISALPHKEENNEKS